MLNLLECTLGEVPLVGHAKAICGQLLAGLAETPVKCPKDSRWVAPWVALSHSSLAFDGFVIPHSSPKGYGSEGIFY